MREPIVLKVTSLDRADFVKIEKSLGRDYNVAETSKPILDEENQKWHIFLALFEKVM